MDDKTENEMSSVKLSSAKSMRNSLHAIIEGNAGLDSRRKSMLNRIPDSGSWCMLNLNSFTSGRGYSGTFS